MPRRNTYDRLLGEFQEAYATYGGYHLWFAAVTQEEYAAHAFLQDCFVGIVPQRDLAWYIVSQIVHAARGDRLRKLHSSCSKAFEKLGLRAGAALPGCIRNKLISSPDDTPSEPLSWWLLLLWRLRPLTAENLATPEGVSLPTRIVCSSPFLASIDAIEICQLNTDHPRWIDSNKPAAKGKRIDERMLATIRDNQEAMYWSGNQWAEQLDCAKSTVVESRKWKTVCLPARERERLARGHRLRGQKRKSNSMQDEPDG
jgi:hypothetical protein